MADEFAPDSSSDVFFSNFSDAKKWALQHPGKAFSPSGLGYVAKNSLSVPRGLNRFAYQFLCEPVSLRNLEGFNKANDRKSIMDAATEGDVERLRQYLHASASRYSLKSEGHMVQIRFDDAIKYACKAGNMSTCKWLINIGASRLAGLEASLQSGNVDIFDWIIEQGLNFDSFRGEKALIAAQKVGDLKRFKRLIDRGVADFALPLWVAARDGAAEFCELLLESGANVSAPRWHEDKDDTPLSIAVRQQQLKACEILIRYGANVNRPDEEGSYFGPLTYAKEGSEIEALLLRHGAK